jgi:hypothetical protein
MNTETEISSAQINDIKSREWLNNLELIVIFKQLDGGSLVSTNKYSEIVKQIIFAVVPKHEREWNRETFEWLIFYEAGANRIQETLCKNNIKFLLLSME